MNLEHTLARKGGRPKRQDVTRDANGKIREDVRKLPQWNKLRENARLISMDTRLATQRGKLFYVHTITETEFEAANRWADLLEGYDRLILGMHRTPASAALERIGFGETGERPAEAIESFRARFKAAHDALLGAGKVAEAAVTKLCRDETAGAMMGDAHRGLAKLIEHFGLGQGRRR